MWKKLKYIGLSDDATSWIESYLRNHITFVKIEGYMSPERHIRCGVPLGSTLGLLLFLIYVNERSQSVNCNFLLYADDSSLIVTHNNVSYIEKNITILISHLYVTGLVDNKHSIHLGKTESFLFGTRKK